MTDRIDPRDVALLRHLRALVEGGSARAPETGGHDTVSRRKSSLGRVIDVAWSFPVTDQNGNIAPKNFVREGTRFGRVEWMPDEPGQLVEEDWLIQAQPLNTIENERTPRRIPGGIVLYGLPPFFSRTLGVNELNPLCWWPYDVTGTSGVQCPSNVGGSPFWLVVEGGPEEGCLQRIPIPIHGVTLAVRGRNVSASIEYDPFFAGVGNIITPLEVPVILEGKGRILVTVSKAQPSVRFVADQVREITQRPRGTGPFEVQSLAWIPKFATRLVPITTFEAGTALQFFDQSGTVCSVQGFERNNNVGIPQNAVAVGKAGLSDISKPLPVVFEVYS